MRILMLSNIYTPQMGGITRSIQSFTQRFRDRGHEVLIVTPEAEGRPEREEGVIRIPAVSRAYKHKYSLPLPVPGFVYNTIRDFRPDVMHSHHPFLLGVVAHRGSAVWNVPLVYTHHTRYDVYMRTMMKVPEFVRNLFAETTKGYCQLSDAVIAPSGSIAKLLRERGVTTPITVIPTGVDVAKFSRGDRAGFRKRHGIPEDAFVVGHLGRLSPEKNVGFLAEAVAAYLAGDANAHFLLVGDGESRGAMKHEFERAGVAKRLHTLGLLDGQDVVDAYHAMDVFAFASHSETQGMVLTESMAAGVPVVAVSASGVDDVMRDGENGRVLSEDDAAAFAGALAWVRDLSDADRDRLRTGMARTAEEFSIESCATQMLTVYEGLVSERAREPDDEDAESPWVQSRRLLEYEWKAWGGLVESLQNGLLPGPGNGAVGSDVRGSNRP